MPYKLIATKYICRNVDGKKERRIKAMIDGTAELIIKSQRLVLLVFHRFYNIVYFSLVDETWLNLKRSLGIYDVPTHF